MTEGPNGLTRNPMYVGMAGILLAHAVTRKSVLALLPAGAFVLLIDRFQIPAEETALNAEFAAEFEEYKRDVPRWLDGRSVEFRTGLASGGKK